MDQTITLVAGSVVAYANLTALNLGNNPPPYVLVGATANATISTNTMMVRFALLDTGTDGTGRTPTGFFRYATLSGNSTAIPRMGTDGASGDFALLVSFDDTDTGQFVPYYLDTRGASNRYKWFVSIINALPGSITSVSLVIRLIGEN